MPASKTVRILDAVLVLVFAAAYVACKIHFFSSYSPGTVGAYLARHSVYWLALAATAALNAIVMSLFRARS